MKKTISIAFAAFALLSFTSCQKENAASENQEPALRTITATFESNGTKTTHNDYVTPLWSEGDKILILNASGSEPPITLTNSNILDDGRTITFTTSLSGTLYAVYPASATSMERCNGEITFAIPAVQDGTFGSANICVAKSMEDGDTNKDNLVFRNATAVLEITTAADVVGVDIVAANKIAGPVTASFDGTEVSLTTSSLDRNYVSAVGTSAPTGNVFYLAVAPGATGSTKVNCYKTNLKGLEEKSSKDLQRNVIYSMDLSSVGISNPDLTGQRGALNGHEYVIIKAKYDDPAGTDYSYRKWATMNVGATTVAGSGETCYGDYYAWGETEPYYVARTWDEITKKWIFNTWNTNKSSGYAWSSYCGSESFAEWTPAPYNTTTEILNSEKDAATQNWGTGWRMPTSAEFKALKDATYWNWEDGGYYVYAPQSDDAGKTSSDSGVTGTYNKSGALLFFPAAGLGDGTSLNNAGTSGYYWSSTLLSDYTDDAYYLYFSSGYVNPQNGNNRYGGFSVRPLSDQ